MIYATENFSLVYLSNLRLVTFYPVFPGKKKNCRTGWQWLL
jgi:hypothetical protein